MQTPLPVCNILGNHVFKKSRFTGAGLSDDIEMTQTILGSHENFRLAAAVGVRAEICADLRQIHRCRRRA